MSSSPMKNGGFWTLLQTLRTGDTGPFLNPREILECKYQGKKKAMCWVGVLKGTLLGPFWFVDARNNPVTLNQQTYLDMLQSKLWPILLTHCDLRRLWLMQDGATCHCTERVLTWLHSKFGARIISSRSAIPWPPKARN